MPPPRAQHPLGAATVRLRLDHIITISAVGPLLLTVEQCTPSPSKPPRLSLFLSFSLSLSLFLSLSLSVCLSLSVSLSFLLSGSSLSLFSLSLSLPESDLSLSQKDLSLTETILSNRERERQTDTERESARREVQLITIVGGTCGSVNAEQSSKNPKELQVVGHMHNTIRKGLVHELLNA